MVPYPHTKLAPANFTNIDASPIGNLAPLLKLPSIAHRQFGYMGAWRIAHRQFGYMGTWYMGTWVHGYRVQGTGYRVHGYRVHGY